MAQEIRHANGTRHFGAEWATGKDSQLPSKLEDDRTEYQSGSLITLSKQSFSILNALGDEFSRKILLSSITSGKTVEEISADEHLPLSTCYRRVRELVDQGLMILEKIVITQTGKKYSVYRTSFSDATIRLKGEGVAVETRANADVLGKLLTRRLTTTYPAKNQDDVDGLKVEE